MEKEKEQKDNNNNNNNNHNNNNTHAWPTLVGCPLTKLRNLQKYNYFCFVQFKSQSIECKAYDKERLPSFFFFFSISITGNKEKLSGNTFNDH